MNVTCQRGRREEAKGGREESSFERGKFFFTTRKQALRNKENVPHYSRHLPGAKPRHGWQDAERVAGEEEDAVGVAAHARGLVVLDVVDRVRHARVLRLGHVGVVGLAVFLWEGEK